MTLINFEKTLYIRITYKKVFWIEKRTNCRRCLLLTTSYFPLSLMIKSGRPEMKLKQGIEGKIAIPNLYSTIKGRSNHSFTQLFYLFSSSGATYSNKKLHNLMDWSMKGWRWKQWVSGLVYGKQNLKLLLTIFWLKEKLCLGLGHWIGIIQLLIAGLKKSRYV